MTTIDDTQRSRAIAALFKETIEFNLPVSESYSSEVLHFENDKGQRRVIKRLWSLDKYRREQGYLKLLTDHPLTPKLLDCIEQDGQGYVLMSSLPGLPISDSRDISDKLMFQIGKCLMQQHQYSQKDFDGKDGWHILLDAQFERYMGRIAEADKHVGERAMNLFQKHRSLVPNDAEAVCVHFDFRPGNLLVDHGELTGLIDFESMRGGHASMDFYKLWQSIWLHYPQLITPLLEGYNLQKEWLQADRLTELMQVYSLYHGLAGLSWCNLRDQAESDFAIHNRHVLHQAFSVFG